MQLEQTVEEIQIYNIKWLGFVVWSKKEFEEDRY